MGLLTTTATSLVELILKKYGDDVAGATEELVRVGGFPESVANRIATGELPMDEASRLKRAQEQGYGDVLYRGHYSPHAPKSNQDMWMSDSYDNAFTYADAVSDGTVTPLRHNADNLAYVNAGGKSDRAVTTNNIKNPGIRRGVIRGTDDISEAVKYSDVYQGTHFKGLRDDMHNTSSTERANVYNILGSQPEVKIRHADAAYDPQYTGSNIMGGLALPAAAGLLAAGQSEDADAGPLSKAAKIAALRAEANAARFRPSEPESILDFVQAKAYRQGDEIPDTSYRGGHTAPVDPEYNAPLHDLTGTYPEDVYSANGPRYYGQGDDLDKKSFEVMHEVRGNPGAPVTMYRAVPADAPDEIYPGDWVTTNPDYAVQHAGGHMEPSEYLDEQKWKVLEAETNAGRLRTDGNSPHEYGYTGNATVPMLATTAGLSGAGLLAPQIKDSGFISSPRSEGLFNFTMGARDLERRLEGSPASLLFPSGLVEYLETVNRRTEDPNAMTRGMALLDVLPW